MSTKSLDLDKISKLANLELSPTEKGELEPQLKEVVGFFEQLGEVDTNKVEPTSQTTGLSDITRSDDINNSRVLSAEQATLNARNVNNNYFVVDALLDKDQG